MVEDNKTVSIIVPTFNRANLVMSAVRSVLAQTYHNWELIIVDDASTDDTEAVIRNVADRRIRYHKMPKNRGAAYCRNFGIDAASGSYVGFLDSDDEFHPTKIERHMAMFELSSYDGTVSACQRVDHRNDVLYPLRDICPLSSIMLEFIRKTVTWKMYPIWRKSFIVSHGIYFCEQLNNSQDYQFNAFCVIARPAMGYIPDILGTKHEYTNGADPHKIRNRGSTFRSLRSHLASRRLVREFALYKKVSEAEIKAIDKYVKKHRLSCFYAAWRQSPSVFLRIVVFDLWLSNPFYNIGTCRSEISKTTNLPRP